MQPQEIRKKTCYCILARRAANALTGYYDAALAPFQITIAQFSLMNDISYLKVCNRTQLARQAGLDRTTVVRNLRTLQEKGLVQHAPGEDQRESTVCLTEAGEETLHKVRPEWRKVQNEVEQLLGAEEIQRMQQTFAHIEQLAKKPAAK